MKIYFITFFALFISLKSAAEITIDVYSFGAKKYWIIYDNEHINQSQDLVVFLHGFGASNPACYGGWIKSIVDEGKVVLFPKFQNGIFLPRTKKFQKRVDKAIKKSILKIDQSLALEIGSISFVSHSIGGIISSNLANEYGKTGELEVSSLVMAQPGFKYINLGESREYNNIQKDCKVAIIVGDRDFTAGSAFANKFIKKTPQLSDKVLLKQYDDRHLSEKIKSHHKEPISPDFDFDTGNRNLIIRGALALGTSNQVDEFAYWNTTSTVSQCVETKCKSMLEEISTYMGTWSDDKPIRRMRFINPNVSN